MPKQLDISSFNPELIRTGSERGLLLHGWDKWIEYRTARNLTSHTYDESKAVAVCNVIPEFLHDAKHLVKILLERIKNNAN